MVWGLEPWLLLARITSSTTTASGQYQLFMSQVEDLLKTFWKSKFTWCSFSQFLNPFVVIFWLIPDNECFKRCDHDVLHQRLDFYSSWVRSIFHPGIHVFRSEQRHCGDRQTRYLTRIEGPNHSKQKNEDIIWHYKVSTKPYQSINFSLRGWPCFPRLPRSGESTASEAALGFSFLSHDHHSRTGQSGDLHLLHDELS